MSFAVSTSGRPSRFLERGKALRRIVFVIVLLGTLCFSVVPADTAQSQQKPQPLGDLYALVVGVSEYEDETIPKLTFAANDAIAFADMLEKQEETFNERHIRLLTNEKATRRAIEKFLTRDLRKSGKRDTIVIFLSGHGAYDPERTNDFYFCPYDLEKGYFAATGVKMSGLEFLRGLESRRVLVVADACHAGGFSEYTGSSKDIRPNLSVFMEEFKNSAGRVILTSAGPNQKSWELPEIEGQPEIHNGVFTHFLLQGLRGKADTDRDGSVTVYEAHQYAARMTREATGGRQHPQFEGKHSGTFPIAFSGTIVPPWKLKTSLIHAVASGNLRRVKELRAELLDIVTARDDHNRTSLIVAAENGRLPIVKLLLEQRPDLEAKSDSGDTALIAAAKRGHAEIAKLLLEHGAAVNAKNKDRETALTTAARAGHEEVVRLLLDRNANTRAMNKNGSTALALAAYKGHAGIVKALLDTGADPTAKDFYDRTPISLASRYGRKDVVRTLLNHVPEDTEPTPSRLLVRSILLGDPDRVREALDKGADLNGTTPTGDTPLTLAAGLGHAAIVELLLERGADVNSKITYDSTALSWAAYNGQTDVVKILIDQGAEIDARDEGGSTALTYAAQNGHPEIAVRLIGQGANVNNRTNEGDTPLMLLLDPDEGMKDRLTDETLTQLTKLVIEHGAEVNVKDNRGETPLSLACEHGHTKAAAILSAKGADPNHQAINGSTPLMLAANNGHDKIVRLLLNNGANPDLQDRLGATALFHAARNGHGRIVKLLIENGADALAANREGLTPLDVAGFSGHERVTDTLKRMTATKER